jgi:hypothetical protein
MGKDHRRVDTAVEIIVVLNMEKDGLHGSSNLI